MNLDIKKNSLPKLIIQIIAISPFFLFSLQLLEGASTLVEHALEKKFEGQPLIAITLFFPLFCVASTLSNALTFVAVDSLIKGEGIYFSKIWSRVKEKLTPLLLSSFILGFIFILGFLALVLPGFYFMALYLFVPALILSEPTLPSISSYMYRSTKIAKGAIWKTLGAVIVSVLLSLGTFLLGQTLGTWAGGLTENAILRNGISWTIDVFFTMSSAVCIDVWIAVLFFKLRETVP